MRHPGLRQLIILAGLVAIAGCSTPSGPDGSPIAVSFAVPAAAGKAYIMRTDIGDRRVELTADLAHNWRASTEIRVDQYGTVPVRAVMLTPAGDSVAAVSFSATYQPDYEYWLAAFIATQRPIGICVGTVIATPLTAGGPDTLFVVRGGIPKGAIC